VLNFKYYINTSQGASNLRTHWFSFLSSSAHLWAPRGGRWAKETGLSAPDLYVNGKIVDTSDKQVTDIFGSSRNMLMKVKSTPLSGNKFQFSSFIFPLVLDITADFMNICAYCLIKQRFKSLFSR
jgi:hypothetical protein